LAVSLLDTSDIGREMIV